jgi:hypothetical protein
MLEFLKLTSETDVPSPLAVTVPLINTVALVQGTILTKPSTSETEIEPYEPLLPGAGWGL